MKECCGNCKYNKRDFSETQSKGDAEFRCDNEESEGYGLFIMFDDVCDCFEETDEDD